MSAVCVTNVHKCVQKEKLKGVCDYMMAELETECCLCFSNTEKGEENREIEREIEKTEREGEKLF